MSNNLEKRIAAALNDTSITSNQLAQLISETSGAALECEQAARRERDRATDLTVNVDASELHQRIVAVEIARERLQKALPKLQSALDAATTKENLTRWRKEFDELQAKSGALADELKSVYPDVMHFVCSRHRLRPANRRSPSTSARKRTAASCQRRVPSERLDQLQRRDEVRLADNRAAELERRPRSLATTANDRCVNVRTRYGWRSAHVERRLVESR